MSNVMKYYNGGVFLVVSNPVDILTYIVQKESGLPASMVLGTGTMLDSSRFKYILSEKMHIDVRDVQAFLIGEHGDSQIPVWEMIDVAGMDGLKFCESNNIELDKQSIADSVKNAGAVVIQKKGATYYAIAMGITRIVEAVLMDQNAVLPVSSVLSGMYGISDVALSLPSIVYEKGIRQILDITYSNDELTKLHESADKLKETINEVYPGK